MFRLTSAPRARKFKINVNFKCPNPAVILPDYTLQSTVFYRVDYNYILSEIQFSFSDNPTVPVVLNSSNATFERLSGVPQYASGELNNNNYNGGEYIGYASNTNSSYKITLPSPKTINSLYIGRQTDYNKPTYIRLYSSVDSTNWTLTKEWLNPNLTNFQLTRLIV